MSQQEKGNRFPPDYARHVTSVFAKVDEMLCAALHCLDPVTYSSPFSTRLGDAVPIQYRSVLIQIQHIRSAIDAISKRHHISLPAKQVSAVEACRARVCEAILTVSTLDPHSPRVPGADFPIELPKAYEDDASRLASHLMTLLTNLHSSIRTNEQLGSAPGLESDVSKNSVGIETSLPLQELQRVAENYGMGRLRNSIRDYTDYVASPQITIGFFGAAGAGKSSLINRLVGEAVLPTAARPTTVIPVRIEYDRKAKGVVEFSGSDPDLIDQRRLAEFVDRHYNADNVKCVTQAVFALPSAFLESGIKIVDTPGIELDEPYSGYLDSSAVPWCDIAYVLISAVSTLTTRESNLVRTLVDRGSKVEILVSKIDLVSHEEQLIICDHVIRNLWAQTHVNLPIHPVCIQGEPFQAYESWAQGPLEFALDHCRSHLDDIRKRQLNSLKEHVLDSLQIRLLWHSASPSGDENYVQALDVLNRALVDIRTMIQAVELQSLDRQGAETKIILGIAQHAAVLWNESHETCFDATRLAELAIAAHASSTASSSARSIDTARARASIAIQRSAAILAIPYLSRGFPLPDRGDPPVFMLGSTIQGVLLPTTLGKIFGRWAFYLSARRTLFRHESVSQMLDALSEYKSFLYAWSAQSLRRTAKTLDEYLEYVQALKADRDLACREKNDDLCRSIERIRDVFATPHPPLPNANLAQDPGQISADTGPVRS